MEATVIYSIKETSKKGSDKLYTRRAHDHLNKRNPEEFERYWSTLSSEKKPLVQIIIYIRKVIIETRPMQLAERKITFDIGLQLVKTYGLKHPLPKMEISLEKESGKAKKIFIPKIKKMLFN